MPATPRRWLVLLVVFLGVLPLVVTGVVITIVASHRGSPLTSADCLYIFLQNVPLIAPMLIVWIVARRRLRGE
jgi:hypothetical protein